MTNYFLDLPGSKCGSTNNCQNNSVCYKGFCVCPEKTINKGNANCININSLNKLSENLIRRQFKHLTSLNRQKINKSKNVVKG